jgi:hypothetical protein
MSSAVRCALEALFADPSIGRDALYTPAQGEERMVRVVLRRPDRMLEVGETRLHTATAMIDLRISDAPYLARGDRFEVGGDVLVVQGEPARDQEHLLWTAELRPA